MSAQRALSPTAAPRTTGRLIAALLLGIALGAAGALLVTARTTDASRRRVAARALSPDKSRAAVAFEVPCPEGTCQELRLGASEDTSTVVTIAQQPVLLGDCVDARRQTRGLRDRRFGDVDS